MPVKDSLNHFIASLKNAYKLLRGGHYSIFYDEFQNRLNSESLTFGLERDLHESFENPTAKIKIHIRPLQKDDVDTLLGEEVTAMVNPRTINNQHAIIDAEIPTCFVAVTTGDKPCYMQWLIGSGDNDKLQSHFQGVFPILKPQEALLEGAYGNPKFRGLRIMPAAMAQIAENAFQINARWVKTFVDVTDITSLRSCMRAGFEPYILRKDKWFLFRRTTSFHPLPDSQLGTYNSNSEYNTQKSMNGSRTQTKLQPETQSTE